MVSFKKKCLQVYGIRTLTLWESFYTWPFSNFGIIKKRLFETSIQAMTMHFVDYFICYG